MLRKLLVLSVTGALAVLLLTGCKSGGQQSGSSETTSEPINYQIVLGNDKIAEQFGGLIGLPTSVLYSRDGKKVKTVIGSIMTDPQGLSKTIEAELSRQDASAPSPAPEASTLLADLDGTEVSVAQFKGKVVLVNFWATWCEPCRMEIPWLIESSKKYGPEGLVILGVAMDDAGKKVVEPWVKSQRFDVKGS